MLTSLIIHDHHIVKGSRVITLDQLTLMVSKGSLTQFTVNKRNLLETNIRLVLLLL